MRKTPQSLHSPERYFGGHLRHLSSFHSGAELPTLSPGTPRCSRRRTSSRTSLQRHSRLMQWLPQPHTYAHKVRRQRPHKLVSLRDASAVTPRRRSRHGFARKQNIHSITLSWNCLGSFPGKTADATLCQHPNKTTAPCGNAKRWQQYLLIRGVGPFWLEPSPKVPICVGKVPILAHS